MRGLDHGVEKMVVKFCGFELERLYGWYMVRRLVLPTPFFFEKLMSGLVLLVLGEGRDDGVKTNCAMLLSLEGLMGWSDWKNK